MEFLPGNFDKVEGLSILLSRLRAILRLRKEILLFVSIP